MVILDVESMLRHRASGRLSSELAQTLTAAADEIARLTTLASIGGLGSAVTGARRMHTQQEIDAMAKTLRAQGLTWSQTNFAVSLVRNAAAAERERIAAHFDSRDKGAGGFYDPHEPAEIIRALGGPDVEANRTDTATRETR